MTLPFLCPDLNGETYKIVVKDWMWKSFALFKFQLHQLPPVKMWKQV